MLSCGKNQYQYLLAAQTPIDGLHLHLTRYLPFLILFEVSLMSKLSLLNFAANSMALSCISYKRPCLDQHKPEHQRHRACQQRFAGSGRHGGSLSLCQMLLFIL